MRISCDPAKRDKTLDERGLDFEDAVHVFAGLTVEVEDTRKDYVNAESSATVCSPAGLS